jgi:hypothetical protein
LSVFARRKAMQNSTCSRVAAVVVLGLTVYVSGCAVLIGGAVAGGTAGTVVSAREARHEDHSAITYVGTVLANVAYVPAKVLFAAGGAATTGVAYLVTLGDAEKSRPIWKASVEGDYVVTPSMIEGKEAVNFVG